MGQRELMQRMSAEEVIDWMAYEISITPEFKEKLAKEDKKPLTPEQEADAVRMMFMQMVPQE